MKSSAARPAVGVFVLMFSVAARVNAYGVACCHLDMPICRYLLALYNALGVSCAPVPALHTQELLRLSRRFTSVSVCVTASRNR